MNGAFEPCSALPEAHHLAALTGAAALASACCCPPLPPLQAYPGVPIYVRALDMQHAAALEEAGAPPA